jgi:hypothetical protein
MNRELLNYNKFLSTEIRRLKEHIKKIDDHLIIGENLYKKYKKEVSKNVSLEHKKKVINFKNKRKIYQVKLNELIQLQLNFNKMVKQLQPSTSGRK